MPKLMKSHCHCWDTGLGSLRAHCPCAAAARAEQGTETAKDRAEGEREGFEGPRVLGEGEK